MAANTHGLTGIAITGAWLDVGGPQHGHSATFGAQRARELRGSQWALLGNSTRGVSRGVQVSLGANLADTSTFVGLQTTMGVNWLRGNADGGQFGSVNISRGGLRGGQLGAVNLAEDFSGLQLGLINVGGDVTGTQVGLVNVARDVGGLQLGLVNVARDVRGTPLGLLSFEKEGRHDLLVFASETDWVNGELRLGGDHLYTLLSAGATPGRHLHAGAGFGVHAPITDRLWTDYDVAAHGYAPMIADSPLFSDDPTIVAKGRATVGVQVFGQLAPFVGASVNIGFVRATTRQEAVPLFAPDDYVERGRLSVAAAWPGAFAGMQF